MQGLRVREEQAVDGAGVVAALVQRLCLRPQEVRRQCQRLHPLHLRCPASSMYRGGANCCATHRWGMVQKRYIWAWSLFMARANYEVGQNSSRWCQGGGVHPSWDAVPGVWVLACFTTLMKRCSRSSAAGGACPGSHGPAARYCRTCSGIRRCDRHKMRDTGVEWGSRCSRQDEPAQLLLEVLVCGVPPTCMTVSAGAVARPSPRCAARKSSAQAAWSPSAASLVPASSNEAAGGGRKAPACSSAVTASTTACASEGKI